MRGEGLLFGLAGELAGLGFDRFKLPRGGIGSHVKIARIKLVEAARDFAGKFDVRCLVETYGDEVRLVGEDIGRLQQRVAEKAVGGEVFFPKLLLLIFIGRHPLEPA